MPRRVLRVREAKDELIAAGLRRVHEELALPTGFPAAVEAEAEASAARPRLPALDRTAVPFVTIDPEGSRDLDQALHLERRGSGYRVHYAIADVGAFVDPGGAVDEEAHRRGETLYGIGDKVPLHPRALSESAASLLPEGDRPALVWTVDVDSAGELTLVGVERALVRSRAQLSYAEVQADLDRGTAAEVFEVLREVGTVRLAHERGRGGVSLPLPEQEVVAVDGRWELHFRQPLPVETWNAQVSLLTGMAAARLMLEERTGILRTVPPADPEDVARLHRVAGALGIPWPDEMAYPDFVRTLDPGQPAHAAMLNACTSLLRGSGYVAFHGEVPDQPQHAALAAPYTHVTAPLRRLVDRYTGEIALALCAGRPVPDWVEARMEGLPATMRESARRANGYEREVVDLVEAVLLHDRVGEELPAVVVEVEKGDPSQGRVVVASPAVEARASAAGGGALPLGTEVTAVVAEADVERRRVRFSVR